MGVYDNINGTTVRVASNIRLQNSPVEQYVTEAELVEGLATKMDTSAYDPNGKIATIGGIEKYVGYVTPQMFGAVADGTTDDSTAVAQALANSNNVYFPEGTYALSKQLVLNNNQTIWGDGSDKTTILFTSNDLADGQTYDRGRVVTGVSNYKENPTLVHDIKIKGMTLTSNYDASYHKTILLLTNCTDVQVEDVACIINNIDSHNANAMEVLENGHNITFTNCYFEQSQSDGIGCVEIRGKYSTNTSNIKFFNCSFYKSGAGEDELFGVFAEGYTDPTTGVYHHSYIDGVLCDGCTFESNNINIVEGDNGSYRYFMTTTYGDTKNIVFNNCSITARDYRNAVVKRSNHTNNGEFFFDEQWVFTNCKFDVPQNITTGDSKSIFYYEDGTFNGAIKCVSCNISGGSGAKLAANYFSAIVEDSDIKCYIDGAHCTNCDIHTDDYSQFGANTSYFYDCRFHHGSTTSELQFRAGHIERCYFDSGRAISYEITGASNSINTYTIKNNIFKGGLAIKGIDTKTNRQIALEVVGNEIVTSLNIFGFDEAYFSVQYYNVIDNNVRSTTQGGHPLVYITSLAYKQMTVMHGNSFDEYRLAKTVTSIPTGSNIKPYHVGRIYQYIGETNANFTHGYFYECVSDGEATPTYSWENLGVQEMVDDVVVDLEWTTPQMFGAVGDGVTDDTDAIKAMLQQGGNIYVPEGTYYITQRIRVGHSATKYINMNGAGAQKAVFKIDQNFDITAANDPTAIIFGCDTILRNVGFLMDCDVNEPYVMQTHETVLVSAECNSTFEVDHCWFKVVIPKTTKTDIPEYSEIPTATVDNLGDVIKYIGDTTTQAPIYTKNCLYKCVSDGASTPTYSWRNVYNTEVDGIVINSTKGVNTLWARGTKTFIVTNSLFQNYCNTVTGGCIWWYNHSPRNENNVTDANARYFAEKIYINNNICEHSTRDEAIGLWTDGDTTQAWWDNVQISSNRITHGSFVENVEAFPSDNFMSVNVNSAQTSWNYTPVVIENNTLISNYDARGFIKFRYAVGGLVIRNNYLINNSTTRRVKYELTKSTTSLKEGTLLFICEGYSNVTITNNTYIGNCSITQRSSGVTLPPSGSTVYTTPIIAYFNDGVVLGGNTDFNNNILKCNYTSLNFSNYTEGSPWTPLTNYVSTFGNPIYTIANNFIQTKKNVTLYPTSMDNAHASLYSTFHVTDNTFLNELTSLYISQYRNINWYLERNTFTANTVFQKPNGSEAVINNGSFHMVDNTNLKLRLFEDKVSSNKWSEFEFKGDNQTLEVWQSIGSSTPYSSYNMQMLSQFANKILPDELEIKELPTASAQFLNQVYLLTNAQTGYIQGGIYKCVSDGQSTPTYSWQLINGDTLTLASLQAVVAASSDFADFQARIAAL